MHFHHLGIATDNIEAAVEYLRNFYENIRISDTVYDEMQNAYLCMVEVSDEIRVELIAGEVVNKFIKKHQYVYHICYITECMDEDVKKLQDAGDLLISDLKPAILFQGRRVAFLNGPMGIYELLESK